jgi:hypothetical protein
MHKELEVFYELVSQGNMANGQLETMAVLSNEQLEESACQEIFQLKHFVVNDAPFQRYKFDKFGLGRVFGAHTKLPLIGV